MRGLILAAGRGSRLGGYADGTPKCLLEIGRRRLIEHQLEALADAGVAPVAMVIGYGADEVREAVGIRAEYIHNRRWELTNSVYSYHLAREWITGPLVLLNCDVLFHPEILSRVLAVKSDALAYDSRSGGAPEQMKVAVKDGRVVDMAKDLPPGAWSGENLGVLCLSAETAQALAERAGQVIAEGGENTWLSSALRQVAKERPIQAIDVAGLPWGEIDSAYDLEHVRKRVWPAILGSTGKAKRRGRALRAVALAAAIALAAAAAAYVRSAGDLGYDAWEDAELEGAPGLALKLPNRTQRWWLLEGGAEAAVALKGPGPVRIESRLLLPDGPRSVPYVLRVKLDGKLVDLFKKDALPDPGAPHAQWRLGKRKRVELNLPAGAHKLAVAVLGAEAEMRCLLRVRQPDLDQEPEPDGDEEEQEDRVDLAKQF
jgi:choline kinase